MGSHEGGSHQWPSIGYTVQAMAACMDVVVVVDIVMVKPDVVRVALCPIFQGELIAILDMVFKPAVVHDKPFWFVSHALFMLAIGQLIGEGGGYLA